MDFKQTTKIQQKPKCDADNYSIVNLAVCSGGASSFAAIFGNPLDVVKIKAIRNSIQLRRVTTTNQQIGVFSGANLQTGTVPLLKSLLKDSGVSSLLRGYQLAFSTQLIRAGSFMYFYEHCKFFLANF